MIKTVYWSSSKMHVIIVRFQNKWNFLDIFSKNIQMKNFTKIRPVGEETFHADGQKNVTKLIVAFRNFVNSLQLNTVQHHQVTGTPVTQAKPQIAINIRIGKLRNHLFSWRL